MDSLFFKEHSVKISKFFSIGSTDWHPARPVGIWLDRLASGSTGSSSQLVWSTNFGDFGAQFLHGLGPWTSDQFWAVFWIHFGPYFGFLAAHHESIWIFGGKASWKLKIVNLHGKWGGELLGKLILRLTRALSRAWRREKWRGFDGWRSGTIKEKKIIFEGMSSFSERGDFVESWRRNFTRGFWRVSFREWSEGVKWRGPQTFGGLGYVWRSFAS